MNYSEKSSAPMVGEARSRVSRPVCPATLERLIRTHAPHTRTHPARVTFLIPRTSWRQCGAAAPHTSPVAVVGAREGDGAAARCAGCAAAASAWAASTVTGAGGGAGALQHWPIARAARPSDHHTPALSVSPDQAEKREFRVEIVAT